MNDDKQFDDNSILGDSGGVSEASSTDSGTTVSDEVDSKHLNGEEAVKAEAKAIDNLPEGCNVYYGNYIDNYNGNTRTRYYLDSYGQLIKSQRVVNVNRPTGLVCMTEMPMSHNMDMGIIMAEACAAIAIWLAVKFVVGRLIK